MKTNNIRTNLPIDIYLLNVSQRYGLANGFDRTHISVFSSVLFLKSLN